MNECIWMAIVGGGSVVFCVSAFWRWRAREKKRLAEKNRRLESWLAETLAKQKEEEEEAYLKRPF